MGRRELVVPPVRADPCCGIPWGTEKRPDPKLRQWVQRHNLLAAREGGALPDLTFFRDEHDIVRAGFPTRNLRITTAHQVH